MSLSKSNQKSSNKKSVNVWRFFVLLLVCFASVLTFSACKLVNNNSTSSSFDKDGNLRLTSPVVTFHKYSQFTDASGNFTDEKLIDENSGSFTWELSYYYDADTDDINYDQSYYLANFYEDSSLTKIYNYYAHSNGTKPIHCESGAEAQNYFASLGYTSATLLGSGSGFYGIFQVEVCGNFELGHFVQAAVFLDLQLLQIESRRSTSPSRRSIGA